MASDSNGRNFTQKFADWLFQQGASTVLLTAVLGAIIYGAPQGVTEIQRGYERLAQINREDRAEHAAALDKSVDKLIAEIHAGQELIHEDQRLLREAIDVLRAAAPPRARERPDCERTTGGRGGNGSGSLP